MAGKSGERVRTRDAFGEPCPDMAKGQRAGTTSSPPGAAVRDVPHQPAHRGRRRGSLEEVRTRTYALLEHGLGSQPAATLRGELPGPHTAEIIAALPAALERLRAGAREGAP